MKNPLKIKHLPLLALLLGGGLAFAVQSNHPPKTLLSYYVETEDADFYYTGSQPEGCGEGTQVACQISTEEEPDSQGRIAKGPEVTVTQRRNLSE